MNPIDEFLVHTKKLLSHSLSNSSLDPVGKLSFQTQVYALFQDNFDLEKIYYELLDILEQRDFDHLIPSIDSYYQKNNL
jgi:hypothetical protein